MNAIPFIFPAINITKLRNRESVITETKLKLTFHNYFFFKYKEVKLRITGKQTPTVRIKNTGLGHPRSSPRKKTHMNLLIPYLHDSLGEQD